MADAQIHGRGGAYRGAYIRVLRCKPCGLSALDVSAIANRYRGAQQRLSTTLLCRDRRRVPEACAACRNNLDRVTLSWAATYVELEECERCGLLYLDAGELERIGNLVGDAPELDAEPAWASSDAGLDGALTAIDGWFAQA